MRVAVIMFVFLLAACESNEKKLARLEGDKETQCLNEQYYRERLDSLMKDGTRHSPVIDSLRTRWYGYHERCQLATRDYGRFMR